MCTKTVGSHKWSLSRKNSTTWQNTRVRGRLPGPFCYKSNKLNAGVVFRCSMIIPCQEKKPEQKILIYHDENFFKMLFGIFFEDFQIFPSKLQTFQKNRCLYWTLHWKAGEMCEILKFLKNLNQNFENQFSSWKINILCPGFLSWQGTIILRRKITPALSLFDL